ncbi:hypothetical protein ABVC46_02850 [Lactobacillus crispatus]|uniref:hypothetical protein n=1 Tax=Lactobacillus crispatus TaxID=47770 RepID=UPI001ABEC85C|nr:hypothetical protein [Lactobacillus crispatus]MBO4165987.1 hypothetical protein [Lactobacillus crispatus]MBW0437245.1 hypothetical protein [Lactobacillus crispatus]MBW0443708.1 hypothetical protein [Lactobacillus crispatus]MBW0455842.1 hypothetical protein [Lactobacillus crispatus]MCT7687496.1 hypothetical protein [Lactobacillus crispatus]
MSNEYECDGCGALLENGDDVIFVDRAFMPSGGVFCDVDCLLHFLGAYESNFEDIKPLIDADSKYPMTIPAKTRGGDRNEACSEVRLLASKNKWISKY